MKRRSFLRIIISSAAIAMAAVSSLLKPLFAFADWNKDAFSAVTKVDAIAKFFPDQIITPSNRIEIGVYDLVENGAVVPVKINTDLPKVESISILVDKNPNPLIANFDFAEECTGFIATRIKMNESSNIVAIVKSQGGLYSTRKYVEVAEGGCG